MAFFVTTPTTLPTTAVSTTFFTVSDIYPLVPTPATVTFTFPWVMTADPLTSVGEKGSEPDNKSPWWPYFQARHKAEALYWVQGHMLNHHVHGKGNTANLVPISNTLNTNMSAMVEELVKKMVDQGKILKYVVQAHWDGYKANDVPTDMLKHPENMRKICGIQGLDPDGKLGSGSV